MIVGINCGHTVSGTIGSGAMGFINESNATRVVGYKLMDYLRDNGVTVVDCTDDYSASVSENLSKIVSKANAQPLDLFVSIHFNAGGGRGVEVYTYGGENFKQAESVCKNMAEFGFINRGIKDGKSLYVIRHSDAKAMLIEVCFVDNESDAELYKNVGADAVAKAIYNAITGENNKIESEDLTMTQYEELKKLIQAQQPMVYDYMDDNMPEWAKPTIQKLMDKGILQGDEHGKLGLSMDAIRIFVANDRAGLYN